MEGGGLKQHGTDYAKHAKILRFFFFRLNVTEMTRVPVKKNLTDPNK